MVFIHHLPLTTHNSKVRYRVMAFLLALSFLTYFDRVCIMRVQADIQAELHIDDGGMALFSAPVWLAYAIFEIPAGWLGDRFGRGALTRVVLAWSLFTALTGLAGGFMSLLTIRFLLARRSRSVSQHGSGAIVLAEPGGTRPGRRLAVVGRPLGWRSSVRSCSRP